MAKLTWKKDFNGYKVNLNFICHYKDGLIVEFDSHDMSDTINKLFNEMTNADYQRLMKIGFLGLSAYLFDRLPSLFSVEFTSNNSNSEYFKEDIKQIDSVNI